MNNIPGHTPLSDYRLRSNEANVSNPYLELLGEVVWAAVAMVASGVLGAIAALVYWGAKTW